MILIFETSKNVFPSTCFGFDICNPKLFALKNRSSIVPSLQSIKFIYFLMMFMSKTYHILIKFRKWKLTSATIRTKMRWIQWLCPFCMKPSKMMSFWRFLFWHFLRFFIFLGWRHEDLALKFEPTGHIQTFLKAAEELGAHGRELHYPVVGNRYTAIDGRTMLCVAPSRSLDY